MSNWIYTNGPLSKSALNSALSTATIASATIMDHPSIPVSAGAGVHFTAAASAAQSALAALTGNATKARVKMTGRADTNLSERSGMTGSSLTIEVVEVW
jgi:hypothetical protein